MKQALIVFARPAVPGRVKTRMTSVLTEKEAARLYEAFLRDALEQYRALDVGVRLYTTSPMESMPAAFAEEGITLHEQQGAGRGARMEQAFRETFDAGYARCVIIGTDHPTLPPARVEEAFAALTPGPAVSIGPSADGGYYLLGLTGPQQALFEDMTYSHAGVFRETMRRARDLPARLTVLPEWYDVDTPEDLVRLSRDLMRKPGAAPRTRETLADVQRAHPALFD